MNRNPVVAPEQRAEYGAPVTDVEAGMTPADQAEVDSFAAYLKQTAGVTVKVDMAPKAPAKPKAKSKAKRTK